MTRLLVVRHGETDWNRNGIVLGRAPGVPLNAKGRHDAGLLAEALSTQGIVAVYSSPMERAMETAQILCDRIGLPGPIPTEGILEVDPGEWTGKSRDELLDDPIWIAAHENPLGVRYPNGEELSEVQARAMATIEPLIEKHVHQTFAIVTHGDVIRSIMAHYMGLSLAYALRIIYDTASVSVVEFKEGESRVIRASWRVVDCKLPLDSAFTD
jgi:broad specificity phosphatase PhoE